MPVTYLTGDLFDLLQGTPGRPRVDALANGVNCQAKMGAGIALQFRRRWPAMYEAYRAECQAGRLRPGGLFAWEAGLTGPWIYNLASQDRTGADARLDAIEASLTAALTHAEDHFLSSIGLPRIGAKIGGLPWPAVREVIERVGSSTGIDLVVVTLPGEAAPGEGRMHATSPARRESW